jgi:accessory colonization factor AcfC
MDCARRILEHDMVSEKYSLRIYSAGAVAPPLQEATRLFQKEMGIRCLVNVGKPEALLAAIAASKTGDIFSGGAEYVLDDAEDQGLVIPGKRRSLGYRRSVIIVQPGNPKGISSLEDLCQEGIRIGIATGGCLKGVWDDVASKAGLTEQIRKNITRHADTCGSLMSLIHTQDVDAIIGWNAFKNIWPDTCETIELPGDIQIFRSTGIGVLTYTKNLSLSERYINYLISPVAEKIYSSYGWIHQISH